MLRTNEETKQKSAPWISRNKNIEIKFSVHDRRVSGTLEIERLESQIISRVLGSNVFLIKL